MHPDRIVDHSGLAAEIASTVPLVKRAQPWITSSRARIYVDIVGVRGRDAPCIYIDLQNREVHLVNWQDDLAFHKRFGPTVDGVQRLAASWP